MKSTNPLSTVHDVNGLRDEIRLQLHLANAELRKEFEELEERWEKTLNRVRPAASSSADEVGEAASQLIDEMGQSFRRIRDALRQQSTGKV